VKLGSFGHNSIEYYAYISSPWPCVIIRVRVISNCPSPDIILLHTCNLGSAIFAWSILSWIIHKNSSFDRIDFVFQVRYKILHDFWCRICFLALFHTLKPHYYSFPIWISSPSGIHKQCILQTQTPTFALFTFRWCLFFNLFIVDWKIPPMFNSLFICQPKNTKTKKILAFPQQMYVSKYTFKYPFQFLEKKVLVVPYNSLDHCILVNSSIFQAKNIAHLVYHFQSLSFDAT